MAFAIRTSALAIAGFVAGTAAASAATIDFTDTATFSSRSAASATGSVGGLNFTLTGSSNRLTYQDDGVGLGDDEIGRSEYVTVTFDRTVRLTSVSFMDLFRSGNGSSESASIYSGAPPTGTNYLGSFDATELYRAGGAGAGTFAVNFTGTSFTFDAGAGNDGVGVGDFALAGLELDGLVPVPLPAGALLLGTALFGFGVVRRKS